MSIRYKLQVNKGIFYCRWTSRENLLAAAQDEEGDPQVLYSNLYPFKGASLIVLLSASVCVNICATKTPNHSLNHTVSATPNSRTENNYLSVTSPKDSILGKDLLTLVYSLVMFTSRPRPEHILESPPSYLWLSTTSKPVGRTSSASRRENRWEITWALLKALMFTQFQRITLRKV